LGIAHNTKTKGRGEGGGSGAQGERGANDVAFGDDFHRGTDVGCDAERGAPQHATTREKRSTLYPAFYYRNPALRVNVTSPLHIVWGEGG